MKKTIRILTLFVAAALLASCTAVPREETAVLDGETVQNDNTIQTEQAGEEAMPTEVVQVVLSDEGVTVDGAPAGTQAAAVYLSNDIIYYEDLDAYESGNTYGEGADWERHTAQEAAAHTVVNITAPGVYALSGKLSAGQIRVDLGEEAFADPQAVVTLVLNGVDVTCTVAPAILFMNVYECDNGWSAEVAQSTVDTEAAGANLLLAEDSVNVVNGSHVAKIYKDTGEEKKLWKQDGAIYSYMSMNVDGTGTLELTADNEGLDTELHLTINGGSVNIRSGNDGINTNEDGVSVTTINGGTLHIIAGLGEEGDGIDSNGWLVINGGTVVSSANPAADAGLDSDMGSYVNGGTVVALGSTMDWAESESEQVTMNLQFAEYKNSDDAIVVTKEGAVVFAYDPSADEVLGENTRRYMGAILSAPAFAAGDAYQVFIGGEIVGSETGGVYDAVTVTDYTGGVQQAYTGTDVTMRPGMGGGFGGQRPEGIRPDAQPGEMPPGEMPEPPEGFGPGTMPEGWDPEKLPEGGFGGKGQRPEGAVPDGEFDPENLPEDFDPESLPQMPQGGFGGAQNIFYMQDKVNAFSGVTDGVE